MIPTLHIHLFGDFLLVSGDATVMMVNIPRLQSLLAYLVLHRTAPQARFHLAFLLWPDSTEAQAHSNLRKLLHQLRQALPDADRFLYVDRHSLQWLPEHPDACWTLDVLEFEQAIAQAEQAKQARDTKALRQAFEQALHLYRGDLLPSCYDEWILPERDRLRQLFLQAAEGLIALLEQEREYDAAIKAAQRLLHHDPLQEETYRQLMRFYALRGDRAAALRVYHTCATVLERELGAEPSEATRQVYESLLQLDTSSQPRAGSLSLRGAGAPLVGRKQEWQHLQAAWRRAASGHPHMVVLSGEAGIGKTRLAEELVAWAGRQGMTTASAHCYAAEGRLAYAPVAAWFRVDAIQAGLSTLDDVWLTEVARLVPDLLTQRPDLPHPAPMTEGWQRQHFFVALARAMLGAGTSRSSYGQPLLLLLDDLQWCDNETLEWVHYLLRFEPGTHLHLIGTVRAEEALPEHPLVSFLGTLQREGLVTEIALGPLNTDETTSLAEHVAGHKLNPALVSGLYHETEGNPLFVVEMVRAKTLEDQREDQRVVKEPPPLLIGAASTLPPTVQTVLAARLAQLSPLARELASVAAVIGRAFPFAVLAHASGESEEALVRGLDELWQRRIVRELGGEAYDFSHDKLREEAYAALSSVRKRFLHRRVAEALEEVYKDDLDAVSSQIAAHYEHAGLPERAIPYYRRAGEVAMGVYAGAEAITAFQQAAALLEAAGVRFQHKQSWEVAASVYEHLGDVFAVIGKPQEARQAYQQAMAYIPAQEYIWQARLHREIAKTWNNPTDIKAALHEHKVAEQALEHASDRSSPAWQREWIQLQFDRLLPHRFQVPVQEMTDVIERMEPIVEQYGTVVQRGQFLLSVAVRDLVSDHYGGSEKTISSYRHALLTVEQTGNIGYIGFAHFGLGLSLLFAGNLDEAEEQLRATIKIAEQISHVMLLERALAFLLIVFRRRGQVEEARYTITRASTVPANRHAGMIKGHRAWVAWRDGNVGEAEAYARAALEEWQREQQVSPYQWTGLWPLIGVALTQERLAEAVDYVRMLLAPTQQRPPETLFTMLEAAVRAWDSGQYEAVRALLHQAMPLAQEVGFL